MLLNPFAPKVAEHSKTMSSIMLNYDLRENLQIGGASLIAGQPPKQGYTLCVAVWSKVHRTLCINLAP